VDTNGKPQWRITTIVRIADNFTFFSLKLKQKIDLARLYIRGRDLCEIILTNTVCQGVEKQEL